MFSPLEINLPPPHPRTALSEGDNAVLPRDRGLVRGSGAGRALDLQCMMPAILRSLDCCFKRDSLSAAPFSPELFRRCPGGKFRRVCVCVCVLRWLRAGKSAEENHMAFPIVLPGKECITCSSTSGQCLETPI